ncbi:MAG: cation diffusion facilitator family transporter [Paracoccaceae bacterium]
MSRVMKLAIGSMLVSFVVLGLKMLAWWVTGSVALLSDALESTVNVVTALAALLAIRVAALPADANHPYGHHKAEFFSAVLEGVMIIIAALVILRAAFLGFLAPAPLDAPALGLVFTGIATVLNGAWCWALLTHGRRLNSPALVADGKHLFADVLTSIGVALGLVLALATGWWVLDPLMASIVALVILWSGSKVVKQSLSGLLDEAVPEATLQTIRSTIAAHATGAVQAHDIRTRHAGQRIFIDFHLVVPGESTVNAAHEVCDAVEAALMAAVENANVTIHVEPEEKAKQAGSVTVLPE